MDTIVQNRAVGENNSVENLDKLKTLKARVYDLIVVKEKVEQEMRSLAKDIHALQKE